MQLDALDDANAMPFVRRARTGLDMNADGRICRSAPLTVSIRCSRDRVVTGSVQLSSSSRDRRPTSVVLRLSGHHVPLLSAHRCVTVLRAGTMCGLEP